MRRTLILMGLLVFILSSCTSSYTISFESNGGTEVKSINVDEGKTIAVPTISREGYTLEGWYTSLNGGETFDERWSFTNNTVNSDITLFAKWTINQYTITFDTGGGSEISPITQDYNTDVTAPNDPTREGYAFSGWHVSVPKTMPAENLTLTATWTINQYTITFDTDGGSEISSITQDYNTEITAPANPMREGYTFSGWDVSVPITMPAENLTLTAIWTINLPNLITFFGVEDLEVENGEAFNVLTGVTATGFFSNDEVDYTDLITIISTSSAVNLDTGELDTLQTGVHFVRYEVVLGEGESEFVARHSRYITVKAPAIDSIADVLAVTEVEYDGTVQVTLSGLTIVAKGNQSAFAYDGTGMIMIYGGDMALLEVGKVYTMSATIEWYYGVWELVDWTATEEPGSEPKMPEPEEVTDLEDYIDAMIASGENLYGDGNVASGNFHARYLKVTGKVYVIPGDTSNYNTYLMSSDYDTSQAWVQGTDENPAKGLMFYYDSMNLDEIRTYNGYVVTIEVIVYTYRTDRDAFAIYYIGGSDGIDYSNRNFSNKFSRITTFRYKSLEFDFVYNHSFFEPYVIKKIKKI